MPKAGSYELQDTPGQKEEKILNLLFLSVN